MYQGILNIISEFSEESITKDRKVVLKPFREYIQRNFDEGNTIRLNFICTHNSRRSILSQIWAQAMAFYFNIPEVYTYSGGTVSTAIPDILIRLLISQGFQIQQLSDSENPIYSVKYSKDENPIICFSKEYYNKFNPETDFLALMTCNNADKECPVVSGAIGRISVQYEDPKQFDGSDDEVKKYHEISLEIANEMWYVFKNIE
ncbi:MAG: protein-tyrosine-phosphatase [Saprospiraceae bacterium]